MKNFADIVGCKILQDSSYPMKAEFSNCFIIYSKYFSVLRGASPFLSLLNILGQRFINLQRAALLTSF